MLIDWALIVTDLFLWHCCAFQMPLSADDGPTRRVLSTHTPPSGMRSCRNDRTCDWGSGISVNMVAIAINTCCEGFVFCRP